MLAINSNFKIKNMQQGMGGTLICAQFSYTCHGALYIMIS